MAAKPQSYRQEQFEKDSVKYDELLDQLPYYVATWLNAKAAANRKLSTRIAYAGDMLLFLRFCKDTNPLLKSTEIRDIPHDFIAQLSSEDIIAFLAYLSGGRRSDGHRYDNASQTRQRRLNSIRSFFKFETSHKYLKTNPADGVESVKVEKDKYIRRLSVDQAVALTENVENKSAISSDRRKKYTEHTEMRDAAIINLLLNTGLRISELVGLNLDDVDFNEMCLYVTRKGGSTDRVYMGDDTAALLYDYIHLERANYQASDDEMALFLSMRKNRLQVRGVERMLANYGKEALPNFKNLHPHDLRRTYGTALYDATHDIRLVADVLGHESITTTSKFYVDHKEESKRRAAGLNLFESKAQSPE